MTIHNHKEVQLMFDEFILGLIFGISLTLFVFMIFRDFFLKKFVNSLRIEATPISEEVLNNLRDSQFVDSLSETLDYYEEVISTCRDILACVSKNSEYTDISQSQLHEINSIMLQADRILKILSDVQDRRK